MAFHFNIKRILAPLIVFATITGSVFAADDLQVIEAPQLKAKLDAGEKLFLLNPLSDLEFMEQHIPGSVNISLDQIATSDKLPADKSQLIVTYCLGPQCVMFKKAAEILAQKGYTHILGFRGGIPGWVEAGYTLDKSSELPNVTIPSLQPEDLNKELANVTILDVRTPSLYEMGFIPKSVKIPLDLLTSEFSKIPKDKKVVVVDHSGKQVTVAAQFLHSKGYDASRLQGGLMAWLKAGLPLEK
jgi:rhodanese-related sulfurtransferase